MLGSSIEVFDSKAAATVSAVMSTALNENSADADRSIEGEVAPPWKKKPAAGNMLKRGESVTLKPKSDEERMNTITSSLSTAGI